MATNQHKILTVDEAGLVGCDGNRLRTDLNIDNSISTRKFELSEVLLLGAVVAFFFEGAIRKWLLPLNHPLTYPCAMSKEILTFLGLLVSQKSSSLSSLNKYYHYWIILPLALTICGCFLAALVDFNIAGGILTLRALILLPLGACFIAGILKVKLIKPAVLVITVCAVVNAILSVIQFYSLPTDLINCYVGGTNDGVATTGFSQNVRATGTFSYISGLGFGALVAVATGLVSAQTLNGLKWKLLALVSFACGVVMALTTVSRGPFIAIMVMSLIGLIRSRHLPAILLFALIPSILIYTSLSDEQWEAMPIVEVFSSVFARAQVADSTVERLVRPFTDLAIAIQEYPLGNGLGVGQSAARRFGAGAVVETEFARLVYEIGVIGFVGYLMTYLGATSYLIYMGWQQKRRTAQSFLILCGLFCLLLIYSGVAFNHLSSMVFWVIFVGGCWFADRELTVNGNIRRVHSSNQLRAKYLT